MPEKPPVFIPTENDVKALMAAGAAAGAPKQLHGFTPVIIIPDGYKAETLKPEEFPPLPDHIRQIVTLADLESFATYVKRYQTSATVIFAKVTDTGAEFTAVFDYHRAVKDTPATISPASRVAHKAVYPCPSSHEWKQWRDGNGKQMSQEVFARFIDSNMPDIVDPDSASLLEIVLNFEAHSNVSFSSEVKPQTGARVLKYAETIEGTGNTTNGVMKVPESFKISVPVFYGGKGFDLEAKLFYRPSGGKLQISYELRRPHEVVEAAVKDVVQDIETFTNISPFLGGIGGN